MYVDAYLLDEQANYIRRERAGNAALARLVRLARHTDLSTGTAASLVERVTAAFRPAPEPCPTS